jgi:hypothetical protein
MKKLVYLNYEVQHNHGRNYTATDDIDSETGEFKLKSVPVILKAEQVHEIPSELADELFALAASQPYPVVRQPDAREVMSWQHAHGHLIDAV